MHQQEERSRKGVAAHRSPATVHRGTPLSMIGPMAPQPHGSEAANPRPAPIATNGRGGGSGVGAKRARACRGRGGARRGAPCPPPAHRLFGSCARDAERERVVRRFFAATQEQLLALDTSLEGEKQRRTTETRHLICCRLRWTHWKFPRASFLVVASEALLRVSTCGSAGLRPPRHPRADSVQ